MQLMRDTMCALVASITNENLNDDSSTIKIVNRTFVRKIVRLLVVKNNHHGKFYSQKLTICIFNCDKIIIFYVLYT